MRTAVNHRAPKGVEAELLGCVELLEPALHRAVVSANVGLDQLGGAAMQPAVGGHLDVEVA